MSKYRCRACGAEDSRADSMSDCPETPTRWGEHDWQKVEESTNTDSFITNLPAYSSICHKCGFPGSQHFDEDAPPKPDDERTCLIWTTPDTFLGSGPQSQRNHATITDRAFHCGDLTCEPCNARCSGDDIDLSLLFICLGEQTVVKVEKGVPQGSSAEADRITIMEGPDYHRGNIWLRTGNVALFDATFPEIREAVDALGDKAPVPRLERTGILGTIGAECLLYTVDGSIGLRGSDLDAIAELVGKPLPVYKPHRGEWEELYNPQWHSPFAQLNAQLPFEVWRYTK